ncbi:MAG: valine--tRNA ligase [Candidatus Pacebacteria bacterium]|nr:valine--tRNA ligase [Candidatus Paceibacterota bacterium]
MEESKEISKSYDPKINDTEINKLWEESGFFNSDNLPKSHKKEYSVILPPPNVTGTLHLGHALMVVIQDILIRYHRMKGFKTLWLPGTDHAATATQERVEKDIYKKENKTRYDLGREELLRRIDVFTKESHDTIVNQVKKMGASIDWSREAFTLDEKRNFAVRTAFKKMYDAGLIYRGNRIVNWDPKLGTTISDDEVERVEEKTSFYYLKYGPFTIATARPETKFGDKYVVMHPKDKRYAKYKNGEKLEVEWINGKINATIIKDEAIDMSFGTGVMTITPWHDKIDFEIAQRHNLDFEQIIDLKGKLLPIAGEFSGIHIKKARPLIVEKLKAKGLVEKIDENYIHSVATSERGGGVIEPQILKQWFVDVNKKFKLERSKIKGIKSGSKTTLKEIMEKTVKGGQIKIVPDRFKKIYFHWIENLRDWCISRQLWYGHRIPVWYKGEEVYVGTESPKGDGWIQDEDTLDTWFSSGLWTFSTLGWPEKTKDLEFFHPTNVLETGYDIIFFWVARMILMSGFLLGDIPFKNVYLHGIVRDKEGRKFSKSLGNGIDPLDIIEKYGTDALRMSLITGISPGNDSNFSEDKTRGYRNFATKLWNIGRFIKMNDVADYDPKKIKLSASDKKKIKFAVDLKNKAGKNIGNFKFNEAAYDLYHYAWHEFADKIIEEVKPRLKSENLKDKLSALKMLKDILFEVLKSLHPFMPFVTEAVYKEVYNPKDSKDLLIIAKW